MMTDRIPQHRAALGGVHTLDSESLKEFESHQPKLLPPAVPIACSDTSRPPSTTPAGLLSSSTASSAAQSGRMEGGFNGLKGKKISLITIVLMSTTILMWTWEKTPLLTTLVPAETETRLQVSSDSSVPLERELHVGKGVTTLAERDAWKEEFRAGLGSTLDSGP
ncbi:uncharacterized protein LOC133714020 isoform X2 [Rosa rugosa]|uniref:uncharacterized protein LOC133714020 isoform X2 n=1 Tax=Rosa rugosa TaxID=74645 RepID=UPI002B41416A|nr:uncharacterized protein LOC133714020 isoform X2 [Rosa rugosa]